MRYFTDSQIREMKEKVRNDLSIQDRSLYLAYISKIELLDKQNDEFGNCRDQLMQAIAELEQTTERYIHRGRADPNDEDADAYEYENYNFHQTDD